MTNKVYYSTRFEAYFGEEYEHRNFDVCSECEPKALEAVKAKTKSKDIDSSPEFRVWGAVDSNYKCFLCKRPFTDFK